MISTLLLGSLWVLNEDILPLGDAMLIQQSGH